MSSPRRLTYANVVSTLALVVAVGGGGAAVAAGLQKNSVGSPQIRNGQVKAADLASNAVTSPKIKNGQVTGADVKESSLKTVPSAKRGKNVLAAMVDFNGDLVPGMSYGAVSATGSGGSVEITFNRDVSQCAYIAGPSYPGQASPAGGEVGVASGPDPEEVVVLTYNSAGAFTQMPFTVVVIC